MRSCSLKELTPCIDTFSRMAASREKLRAHRKKKAEKTSVKLVEPIAVEANEAETVREKIKVSTKSRSALVPGDGRSMGMDID